MRALYGDELVEADVEAPGRVYPGVRTHRPRRVARLAQHDGEQLRGQGRHPLDHVVTDAVEAGVARKPPTEHRHVRGEGPVGRGEDVLRRRTAPAEVGESR